MAHTKAMDLKDKIMNMSTVQFGWVMALLVWVMPVVGCKMQTNDVNNGTSNTLGLMPKFLDSLEASKAIVDDDVDGFFEDLTLAEISIQMKNPDLDNDLPKAKKQYKDFIRTQVEDFEEKEIEYMTSVFEEVNKRLKAVNPDLIIPGIKLIKVKLDHYGADVYYTRGNAIMLPKNTLQRKSIEGQTNVMLHEVWHILSRNNKKLREDLYELIGFKPHHITLTLPKSIDQKVLTNPDGVTKAYAIDLGDGIDAIPLIVSTRDKFVKEVPRFFDYIQFDLYEVSDDGNVLATESGKTTIPPQNNAMFFKQIKDNTQYIIHPDEIIADNFMLTVNAKYKDDFDGYSPQGKQLIMDVLSHLEAYRR
jgi:hypothetical protein